MRVRIAARHSDLARLQAQMVGTALDERCGVHVEYAFRASLGDLNLNDPLWKMPEKGVFTEDFLNDLIEERCDLVVHSWKDLPTEPRADTEVVATLPRADSRDLFLLRRDRFAAVAATGRLRVLTSSPRRAYNLDGFFRAYLPTDVKNVEFVNVRGNIPTRMRKLFSEDVDGLILAKAALDRLLEVNGDEYVEVQGELRRLLADSRWMVLPLGVNPSAAAQGALAVEIKRGRDDLRELLSRINCTDTFECVEAERRILASYGGGCHQKIGISVLRRPFGEVTYLRGLTDAGQKLDLVQLKSLSQTDVSRAASDERIWPGPNDSGAEGFFSRQPLPERDWQNAVESARFLWIARESALPERFTPSSEQVVWCAGLATWRKLALRGIWVHGSSEGLGEVEPARVETLAGHIGAPPVQWTKLTHAFSREDESEMRSVATYRLVPQDTVPDLRGKTHFYWMSGSTFDRALELYPEIRAGSHACGPGRTYHYLRARLGPQARIEVFLNRESWRTYVEPRSM